MPPSRVNTRDLRGEGSHGCDGSARRLATGRRESQNRICGMVIRCTPMSSNKSEIMPPLAPRRRGRPFQKGNAGRRLGSRNRTTVVAEALLRNEEIELVRKAIEMAKAGDAQMLKFLLDRVLPKERSVRVDLPPIDRASDAADALRAIIDAVSAGRIAPSEGSSLASLVAACAHSIIIAAVESRKDDIEKGQKEMQSLLRMMTDGSLLPKSL